MSPLLLLSQVENKTIISNSKKGTLESEESNGDIKIKNSSGDILLQLVNENNNEGISFLIPPISSIDDYSNKLYNLDSNLYWNNLQLGSNTPSSGWSLIEESIVTSNPDHMVGIGTNNPNHKLHVENGGIFIKNNINHFNGLIIENNIGRSVLNLKGKTSESNFRSSQLMLTDVSNGSSWRLVNTNENRFIVISHTNSNNFRYPVQIEFSAPTNSFTIDQNGNIGIGTWSDEHKLSVAGSIISEEVVVKLKSDWPDYVFSENYNLMKLKEVEKFIKQNKHLKNIPSATEIKENGVDIAEVQIKLLEKIEELTLYIIEQDKKISKLNDQIIHMESRLDK